MRKTMERNRRLRDPRRKGYHRLEDTDHISQAGQLSLVLPAHMQNNEPHTIHSRRGTYSPEELNFILSFSTFSHGCKGARSAASAGSAPLSILAYS